MFLSRVRIHNFRNFGDFDIALKGHAVILGENRVGKSNLLYALRLVLDSGLSDSARQLKLSDIWDGVELSSEPTVRITLDFASFDDDAALTALLTHYRLEDNFSIARLGYVYKKRPEVIGPPSSEADYEFAIYGSDDENRRVRPDVRRRLVVEMLPALRDAEADLGNWRNSPLRPLIEDAASKIPDADLNNVASQVSTATNELHKLAPINDLEVEVKAEIRALAGTAQDLRTTLSFAPTDSMRLLRALSLYIDDGRRAIGEASLGTANLALLGLKLAEFKWRKQKNERNYTFLCVEEPEAHLHPQLQRRLFQQLFSSADGDARAVLATTHSPTIASITPWHSIVLLKSNGTDGTHGYSLANLNLTAREHEDMQRYLTSERAEILFSRAVIFVEGASEAALLYEFAKSCGHDLDDAGVSVCSVNGVHFTAYVKLATALALPFAVITDWDPSDPPKKALGWRRTAQLLQAIAVVKNGRPMIPADYKLLMDDESKLRTAAQSEGIFLNNSTLEMEIAGSAAAPQLVQTLLEDDTLGTTNKERLETWQNDLTAIDPVQLMGVIAEVGKGRLATRLASVIATIQPPGYIADALNHVFS